MKQKILIFIKLLKKLISPYLKKANIWFRKLVSKIDFDKCLHFIFCYILTLTITSLLDIVLLNVFAIILGSIFTFLIGTSKELWDKDVYGLFDLKDLKADIYGILFGIGYYLFFKFCLAISII